MIFYFSGTGNSRWVAESLGKRLEDAVEDITDVKIEKKEYTLPEGEIFRICFSCLCMGTSYYCDGFLFLCFVYLQLLSMYFFVCTCGDDSGKTADVFL